MDETEFTPEDARDTAVEPLNYAWLGVGVIVYMVVWSKIWGWW